MNIWENAVITKQGLALQAKLIAGNTLTITRAVVGSGSVSPTLLQDQVAVSDPQQTITAFSSITYPATGKAAVTMQLTNDDLTAGYTAMQIGFYATDPDNGEILYFIAQANEGTGTVIPAPSEMTDYTAEFTFYFQYGQADNVTVTVDPAAAVTTDAMETYVNNAITVLQEQIDVMLENMGGGFIEMTESLPVGDRKDDTLYGLVLVDFSAEDSA